MTKAERITELQGIRAFMATREFREIQPRRDAVAKVAALLAYNIHHKSLAEHHGSILSRPQMSSMSYDVAHGELDRLVGQAIAELELGDDPISEIITTNTSVGTKPIMAESKHPLPAEKDIPKMLAKEHGLLWLVVHGHWLVRFKVFAFLLVIFGFGVQAAQSQEFMKAWTWIIAPITAASKLLTR
ncbi:MAG: hypothetical protein V4819_16430 [Verrucomicrobiota bacterium]